MKFATYHAVIQALFSLQAFDRKHRKPTKLIADEGHLRANAAREALKYLASETGLVRTTRTLRRAIWISRKVTGEPSAPYRSDQYLHDALQVQKLARSVPGAKALLGNTDLAQLDVKNNEAHRDLFNAIVKALTVGGHKGLPTYDFSSGSFYWWLTTTSRVTAHRVIQRLTGQTTLY
jgi:hypothetical protein